MTKPCKVSIDLMMEERTIAAQEMKQAAIESRASDIYDEIEEWLQNITPQSTETCHGFTYQDVLVEIIESGCLSGSGWLDRWMDDRAFEIAEEERK